MEGAGEEVRERTSVVQQDKGSVVPRHTPRLFLNRLRHPFRPSEHHICGPYHMVRTTAYGYARIARSGGFHGGGARASRGCSQDPARQRLVSAV